MPSLPSARVIPAQRSVTNAGFPAPKTVQHNVAQRSQAPPVYRPQARTVPVPRTLTVNRVALAPTRIQAQAVQSAAAPPVYRPQAPTTASINRKAMPASPHAVQRALAPPVYRPRTPEISRLANGIKTPMPHPGLYVVRADALQLRPIPGRPFGSN